MHSYLLFFPNHIVTARPFDILSQYLRSCIHLSSEAELSDKWEDLLRQRKTSMIQYVTEHVFFNPSINVLIVLHIKAFLLQRW